MANWLGVVCRDHVLRGIELGIAQINHGKWPALARMDAGDWLFYYSPRTSLRDGVALQAFTAVGRLPDDDLWQADEGCFRPWRRWVVYEPDATEVSLSDVRTRLELTSTPSWGHRLRRGLVELSDHDRDVIASAMGTSTEPHSPGAEGCGGAGAIRVMVTVSPNDEGECSERQEPKGRRGEAQVP